MTHPCARVYIISYFIWHIAYSIFQVSKNCVYRASKSARIMHSTHHSVCRAYPVKSSILSRSTWSWPTPYIHQSCIGLARIVYIHRTWPHIWWFPCREYRVYTVYVWLWQNLFLYLRATCVGALAKEWPRLYVHNVIVCHRMSGGSPASELMVYGIHTGLAITLYTHRIRPYVWWFPCQKYRIYSVYTNKCMVLASPIYIP